MTFSVCSGRRRRRRVTASSQRRTGFPHITEAVIESDKHIMSIYPNMSLILEPEATTELHDQLPFPVYTIGYRLRRCCTTRSMSCARWAGMAPSCTRRRCMRPRAMCRPSCPSAWALWASWASGSSRNTNAPEEGIRDGDGIWSGGVPSIVRGSNGSGDVSGEDHWVGGLNGLLKFNYPFGEV